MIMNKKLLLTSFFLRAKACTSCFDRLFRRGDFAPMGFGAVSKRLVIKQALQDYQSLCVLEQCQNDW